VALNRKFIMAKLSQLNYHNFDNEPKILDFLPKSSRDGCEFTVITGINGSQKSTILREIVRNTLDFEIKDSASGSLTFFNGISDNTNIIATSGALADRYPPKRMAGKPSQFDDPRYVYLGQRVGTNLLSKKNAVENLVFHLLSETRPTRFNTPFFSRLFKTVGLLPELNFTFQTKAKRVSKMNFKLGLPNRSLFECLNNIVDGKVSDKDQGSGYYRYISRKEASYLLNEFNYDTFGDLHELESQSAKIFLRMNESEIMSNVDKDVIRLGLISEDLALLGTEVTSRSRGKNYSMYDLSSGEFHFLFNILGIGFASNEQSIVLLDEPENSLHPKWQIEFMDMLAELSLEMVNGHIVIATHSPLIVSSAPSYSNIVDLGLEFEFDDDKHSLFGASTDEILIDHFGLTSTRNFYFVSLLQEVVDLFSNGMTNTEKYSKKIQELAKIKKGLSEIDPMHEVIDALLEASHRNV